MIGAIRQEILSGIRASELFRKLRDRLRAFSDESVDATEYEEAATSFNRCRAKGLPRPGGWALAGSPRSSVHGSGPALGGGRAGLRGAVLVRGRPQEEVSRGRGVQA